MEHFKHWKQMWSTWDLRILILVSLLLQIVLTFSAPWRKRVSKVWISIPIWLAYMLADTTSNFALGLITQNQCEKFGPFRNPDLLAFWAPFLLVHLGGPDTITAFSLEDNELWRRHLFVLGFECWAVAYAFFHSYPYQKLWPPTLLMFIAGLIKYIERTRALYLASSRRFKDSLLPEPDPGHNYAKFMDEYTSKKEAGLPTIIENVREHRRVTRIENKKDSADLSDLEVVQQAFGFFVTFNGLISDLIFSSHEDNSRDFFLKRTSRDAFKVVEVELNFFYEALYTKATVVQQKLGYAFRVISIGLNCAAIALFNCHVEKKDFEKIDIRITYTLLFGAIALDLVAFIMVLYSDWTAVALTMYEHPNWFIRILMTLLMVNRERWPKDARKKPRCFPFGKIMQIVQRRWSESLSTFNLINYCMHPRSKWWEKTSDFFGLTNMLDGMKYVKTEDFTDDLRDLIFEELTMKSNRVRDLETGMKRFSARGNWILELENCTDLPCWVNEFDFDESLLIWHIATELCYNIDDDSELTNNGSTSATNPNGAHEKNLRELSKLLSDYMLYLLISQGTMLSTIAGIEQIRFNDTCAEAKKFFLERKIGKLEEGGNCYLKIFSFCKWFCGSELEKQQQQSQTNCCYVKCCGKGGKQLDELLLGACKSIITVSTEVDPRCVKGEKSKSVLFLGSMLAKELRKLGRQRMWEIVSKVWVELLSFAAIHCRGNTHAAQLSEGGQLLSLVWLLMAHLGLGNQFKINEGHASSQMIVGK